MTTQEFSNEFDILLNSYSGVGLELDEYEKSVLLTEAQEQVIIGLYNGTLKGKSLEETEELRRALDSLIETECPQPVYNLKGIDPNSHFFEPSDNVWFITYESVETDGAYCASNQEAEVIPMKQDEWNRSKNNPFRRPNRRKVIRLDNGNNILELVSPYNLREYVIRYISKPTPIILTPLEGTLSINDLQEVTECKLNTVLHRTILERAVELASKRIPASKNNIV